MKQFILDAQGQRLDEREVHHLTSRLSQVVLPYFRSPPNEPTRLYLQKLTTKVVESLVKGKQWTGPNILTNVEIKDTPMLHYEIMLTVCIPAVASGKVRFL